MSEKIDVVWEGSGCVITIKGRIEKADLHRLAVPEQRVERSALVEYVLTDLREADYSRISQRDISLMIAHSMGGSSQNPGMKIAVVATDAHVVRMCEYYMATMSQLGTSWQTRIFDTMEEARAWIAG